MPAPIPYAGGTLDRLGERRSDPALVTETLADPRTRAVVVGDRGVLVDGTVELSGADPWALTEDGELLHAGRVPLAGRTLVGQGADGDGAPLLLGVDADGTAVYVAEAGPEDELSDLRAAAAVLSPQDAGLLAYASTLRHWHRTHAFCGVCGRPNVSGDAGHVRTCPDGHQTHPRTDPVVIMLVTDGADRVLLGRQPSWPPDRWSSLAGFVEPGESLEAAVAREVAEEAGILVDEVRYVATQPWPFPASLMIGCEARWVSGDAHVVDAELEDVRWFTREEIAAAVAGDPGAPLLLPPSIAIARHLLDRWLAG
ncbi:NAD(+) diphosphatase [Conexibacter sp. W3-3-2]|uniref:NAD(+) diphosphatase n=1 Tax=Paraconexibacter algicola TaxID=2133960 RepID=A0A2T4UJC8_9ACTN|nr:MULTISPECIES: NAD(+) diphosphatase [Solirubrobacterales]MTD45680.1 NAD(+) diphosphatase [Conexibacter sp. W3-3-2]PTL59346.1 NAD(+) diphosphatase [Paraconexibacter algicola]